MKKFLNKYKTVFTYLLSSGLSFIVDIILFSIILYFIKDRFVDAILLSSYVARAISSVVNYIVNNIHNKDVLYRLGQLSYDLALKDRVQSLHLCRFL